MNNFLNEALESASRRIDVALKATSAELACIRANVLERVAAAQELEEHLSGYHTE